MSNPIENGHAILTEEFLDQEILPLEPPKDIDWVAMEKETEEVLKYVPDSELSELDSPFAQMMQHPLLTHEQELSLGRQIQAGSLQARNNLVDHNYRLVYSWAKKKSDSTGFPVMDLFQEGSIGMMTAADKFDPDRNIKFSTYASWWIRQAIIRAIQYQSAAIRRPANVRSKEPDILNAVETIDLANRERVAEGSPLIDKNYEAIASEANELRKARRPARLNKTRRVVNGHDTAGPITPKDVKLVLNAARVIASTDVSIPSSDGDLTFADIHRDLDAESVEDLAVRKALGHEVAELLPRLPARERIVLMARVGFDNGRNQTLQEVGQQLGISSERARQIEARALATMRNFPEIKEIEREGVY